LPYQVAQREKFNGELEEERARLRGVHQSENAKLNKQLASLRQNDQDRYGQIRKQFAAEVEDAKRGGKQAAEREKEKGRLEKESWQTMMLRKLEADLRDDFDKERDAEIDLVIERLGEEQAAATQQQQHKHEKEMADLKKRHETDNAKYRNQSQQLSAKYMALSAEAQESEKRYAELESRSSNHKMSLGDRDRRLKKAEEELGAAKHRLHGIEVELGEKHAAETEGLETKLRALQTRRGQQREEVEEEINLLQAGHEARVRSLQQTQKEEMSTLESRVRAAIAKKDGVLQQIRHQLEEKDAQFQQLNAMFKKQREELASMHDDGY
jgi:hypothetical protein